ncbi:MAG: hypothetical protein JNN07_07990 [Verrucomicrobiales bacterium]|nr:hypothetical protein [Verrucomicrobiales bacterium]
MLLVEGKDEVNVLDAICVRKGITTPAIKEQQGIERLLNVLPVFLKGSDIDSLGVIIDCDTSTAASWAALKARLEGAGFDMVPNEPDLSGTILLPPQRSYLPRVGVWLMPDNSSKGILEDFLRFMVPSARLWDYAKSCLVGIPNEEVRFSDLDRPKALIHTWLAWQEEPGRPFGTAIRARFLNTDVPEVDVFASWLRRLFDPQR